jgi:hypothetical protein
MASSSATWFQLRITGRATTLYAATTVNERLFSTGLLEAWDEAVRQRDRACMIALPMSVELAAEQAAFTADTALVNRG